MIGRSLPIGDMLGRLKKTDGVTLLGIGPVTRNVVLASIELAKQHDFPLFLIASRNQVDTDELGGGYVLGWDQNRFVEDVRRMAQSVSFDGPIYFCRDHGGPWQRDEELRSKIDPREAVRIGKESFVADLKAGFDVLHVDPTKNPFPQEPEVAFRNVIDHTVQLIAEVEAERARLSLPPVAYEVGTEDIKGGLTSPELFRRYLVTLKDELSARGLPQPDFVVGQTGTLVAMDTNVGEFHPETAQTLAATARENGLLLKEHNADYLDTGSLRLHPVLGISSANVAPEFGVAETRALVGLSYQAKSGPRFRDVLSRKVLESGKWSKWLAPHLKGASAEEIGKRPGLLFRATAVCGHYFLNEPEVDAAVRELLRDVASEVPSPERVVIDAVKEAILKYVEAFNLKHLTSVLSGRGDVSN